MPFDQIVLPEQLKPPQDDALMMWVIYDHPSDAPHAFVLRAHSVLTDGSIIVSSVAWYGKTPDELRAILPPGVVSLGRQPEDDPEIVEVWA